MIHNNIQSTLTFNNVFFQADNVYSNNKNLVWKTNKIKLKLMIISNIWKRENLNNNFKSMTSLAKDNYNMAYCKPTVITL